MMTSSNDRVRKLVELKRKSRINRLFYDKYYDCPDIRLTGIIQSPEKSSLDRVQLDLNKNEFIHLFAFNQEGSYFSLKLSIINLYPYGIQHRESQFRLANVNFVFGLKSNESNNLFVKYKYKFEQLIDYNDKREQKWKHEERNVYKIGSLSLETVLPFSFSRILFNGLAKRVGTNNETLLVPIKVSISTHPTCDKFDFKYCFDSKYTTKIIEKSINCLKINERDEEREEQLLDLILDDRFDQPLMFRGQLEDYSFSNDETNSNNGKQQFIMWGGKSKKFLNVEQKGEEGKYELKNSIKRNNLFAWVESGQQLHLTRPISSNCNNLITGLVHNSYDYASYLYDCKLIKQEDEEGEGEANCLFNSLKSFNDLQVNHLIKFKAFQVKEYTMKIINQSDESEPFKVNINGFDGWAMVDYENLNEFIHRGQTKLMQMFIMKQTSSFSQQLLSSILAEEQLLGGKASSLIQLANFNSLNKFTIQQGKVEVSIPRAIILTNLAYKHWLQSDERIVNIINKLDIHRRTLAAKSVFVNPLSEKFLTLTEYQKSLKEECERVSELLRSFELPQDLKETLKSNLIELFSNDKEIENLNEKQFAIRSSAVGEDSLETSAAGQMKTFLGIRGFGQLFDSIVACWVSQFEFEAVSYKTQNGLDFNLDMSVVVQELIECQIAGVASTCNPLTGNKMQMEISANLGLGEGVVSGKQTDTIRLELARANLIWNEQLEVYTGELTNSNCIEYISICSNDNNNDQLNCCLSSEQIIALGNLLLQLRQHYSNSIKEREIEWGITTIDTTKSDSSSSSSSSSESGYGFQIHLLQSRPLTNLQKLSSQEIDHELDYGVCSPLDQMSRANLGEVMPGALCPLNSSYFQPIGQSYGSMKPFELNHTRKIFVADSFCFYGQIAMMVISYTDTVRRWVSTEANKEQREFAMIAIQTMIGTQFEELKDENQINLIERFHIEKVNPLSKSMNRGLSLLLAMDFGLYQLFKLKYNYVNKSTKLLDNLPNIEMLIEQMETNMLNEDFNCGQQIIDNQFSIIEQQTSTLWLRLCTKTELMAESWINHMIATITSMVLNMMCLKIMSSQAEYPDDLRSGEILNDFSTMMRQPEINNQLGKQTESGDISKLLTQLIELIIDSGQLEQIKLMSHRQLYDYLNNYNNINNDNDQNKSHRAASKLFKNFLKLNGHRAYKEFCLATKTWDDDCSYIIEALAMRLKNANNKSDIDANGDDRFKVEKEKKIAAELEEHSRKVAQIEAKFNGAKLLLIKYAFSRARNATVRREQSKSRLIKTVHKYRLAFRHLGGLLCLLGRLPSADLIFQLTSEEIDQIINHKQFGIKKPHQDLPRIIHKARRRQQRAKLYDRVQFPKPNLRFDAMVESIEQQLTGTVTGGAGQGLNSASNGNDSPSSVTGMTSCSGKVIGRACVVASLSEMEQLQPNDILITYSIDISWSVYFFSLAGIVTELGGIISHGAVVAREYGIPTLCTAVGACSKFKTGQIVTLDADNGICYLAKEHEQESKLSNSGEI